MTGSDRSIGIVGLFGANHLGGSLARAAEALGWRPVLFDAMEAEAPSRIGRSLLGRAGVRRPLRLKGFGRSVLDTCSRQHIRFLLATGRAPLADTELGSLRAAGVTTGVFSSDDPWNAAQRAAWYLAALREYDVVFTPRGHTVPDFEANGCARVETVPFGYDERFIVAPDATAAGPKVLFVGGADQDRADFMTAFAAEGVVASVVGAYWARYPIAGITDLGHRSPEAVAALTQAASINICLVRRANRDRHVMRTYEMAATGATMVVEDTADHRALFGPEGEAVVYFGTPAEAAAKCRALLADEPMRLRLRTEARRRVVDGANSYRDRLRLMLASMADARARSAAQA